MAYRILALDGGGTWALIQVLALIDMYGKDARGDAVLAEFDMAAATSGGSLVLGGLVEGLPLNDLLGYFLDENKRRSIFSDTPNIGDRILEGLLQFGPKYSAKRKLPAIEHLIPGKGLTPMSEAAKGIRRKGSSTDVHLLVPAFSYDRERACFFRSAPTGQTPGWGKGAATTNVTLAEAIHASTNAPVMYFDGPAEFPGKPDLRFWDGAISGCNNPVLVAVAEALSLGVTANDIAALSIGTGTVMLPWVPDTPQPPYTQPVSGTGLVSDLKKLAGSINDDPPDAASYLAHAMTGGSVGVRAPADSRIVRLNPRISPILTDGVWGPPGNLSPAQFDYLANLHMDVLDQQDVMYVHNYAKIWIAGLAPNQPVRLDAATMTAEIGQGDYASATAAWRAIM